ncbi:hypothetical protein V6N11_059216 [Hibiscus sabdariffa]|uniref:RNase H type-1 domain-containing protein n=1 Tax=Hibiscus sabdariffa TaxID=183260 RepID=A0ABR2U6S9_9ROSI
MPGGHNYLVYGHQTRVTGVFYSLDIHEWIQLNLDGGCRFSRNPLHWDIMFGYILWNLWTQRNTRIFDVDMVYHEPILVRSSHLVSEVVTSNTQQLVGFAAASLGQEPHKLQKWVLIHKGWVTCNADGSFRAVSGSATCGGVLRNHHGEWIVGFAKSIGICSAIKAELWGIYKCPKYAWELGITRLQMESDCGRAIQTLKDRGIRHSVSLVHHIWDLMDRQWEVHLLVINRESNKVADALANLAWKLSFGFYDFVDPPSSVSSLVMADLPG